MKFLPFNKWQKRNGPNYKCSNWIQDHSGRRWHLFCNRNSSKIEKGNRYLEKNSYVRLHFTCMVIPQWTIVKINTFFELSIFFLFLKKNALQKIVWTKYFNKYNIPQFHKKQMPNMGYELIDIIHHRHLLKHLWDCVFQILQIQEWNKMGSTMFP